MKRVGIYARVSTDQQEREETIESQLDQLRSLAASQQMTVLDRHVYTDEGYSGDALARPGLDRLRDDVRDGLLDVVLIHCPDRLARRYAYQVVVVEEMERCGCEICFVNRPITNTPEDQMLLAMQGVIAEYERTKILERTRRGRLFKARTGVLTTGVAPYGYRYIPRQGREHGRIEIVPEHAEVVREIFHWVAREGLSIQAIARRLMKLDVRAPHGGLRWGSSTLHQILRNRAYIGEYCCNRVMSVETKQSKPGMYRRRQKSGRRIRPPEEWIIVPIPAIIDRDLFSAVGQRLVQNRRFALRNTDPNRQCLLRCLVRCGSCGYSMAADSNNRRGNVYSYYTCIRHSKPDRIGDGSRCPAPPMKAEVLDAIVWNDLYDLMSDPVRVARFAGLDEKAADAQLHQEADRLSREVRDCERQLQRLVDAYQQGAIEVDELLPRQKGVSERKATLVQQLKGVEKTINDAEVRSTIRSHLPSLLHNIQSSLQTADFKTRQEVARLLIERVVVAPNLGVEIHYHLPLAGIRGVSPPEKDPTSQPPERLFSLTSRGVSSNFPLHSASHGS